MLGRTNAGGGGGLNFKIIAYATETALLASNPKENTIGVVTDKKVTSWVASAEQPENVLEGCVWICTGTISQFAFNALKASKSAIIVYPLYAMQYVSGGWVELECKSYMGGEWVSWWNGELYVNGNEYEIATGGWWNNPDLFYRATATYSNSKLDLSGYLGEYITVAAVGSVFTNATTRNKIDLTDYTKLQYDIIADSDKHDPMVCIHSMESGNMKDNWIAASKNGVIDISALSGGYYISVISANNRTIKVGNIRLV